MKEKFNIWLKFALMYVPGFKRRYYRYEATTRSAPDPSPRNVGRSGEKPVRINRRPTFGAWAHYPGLIHLLASRSRTFLCGWLIT